MDRIGEFLVKHVYVVIGLLLFAALFNLVAIWVGAGTVFNAAFIGIDAFLAGYILADHD